MTTQCATPGAFLIEGEGWDVKTYADAITFLSSNDYIRPGCLLLDVRMPHMSGLELQLKLREAGCDLPIIFISGHGDIDMAVNTLKAGAIDFLQKPVDDQRLLKTIENAVSHNLAQRRGKREVTDFRNRLESLTAARARSHPHGCPGLLQQRGCPRIRHFGKDRPGPPRLRLPQA